MDVQTLGSVIAVVGVLVAGYSKLAGLAVAVRMQGERMDRIEDLLRELLKGERL